MGTVVRAGAVPADNEVAQRRSRICARDRLLAIWESSPVLSGEDAEFMDRAVREAREASLADTVSA